MQTGQRLRRYGSGVIKDGTRLREILMEDGTRYQGKVFIDATYEGDLLAEAGTRYRAGRESNSEFGETLNGSQSAGWAPTLRGLKSIRAEELAAMDGPKHPLYHQGLVAMDSFNHQLMPALDPYIIPGDRTSGLIPGIDPSPLAPDGTGDHRVQPYPDFRCFWRKSTIFALLRPADPLFYWGVGPQEAVVETCPIDNPTQRALFFGRIYVFAPEQTKEGWQGAPLLERG